MNLTDLRHLLVHVPADRLGRLYDQHRAAKGAENIDAFLDFLLDRGVIDAQTYRALNEPTHVGITELPEDVLPQGARASGRSSFEVRGLLGRGAMGEVRVARDRALYRKVAYKTMGTRYTGKQIEKRFLAEARITAQLDHPNIVPVYTLERDEKGAPAYAMRLVQGRTFRQLFDAARAQAKEGPPDRDHRLATRLEHFLKVCDAIAYAHNKGVLHRDLKPANVMIGRFHEVYVMDWGLAKLVGRPDPRDGSDSGDQTSRVQITEDGETGYERTRMGQMVGTLAYMAPEQARGEVDDLGPAVDQFALGLMLYEVLTLRHPYLGDDQSGAPPWLAERVKHARLLPLDWRQTSERVDPALLAILRRATSCAVADRYASVEHLARDLRRVQRDEAPHALPDDALRAGRRWLRHNTVLAVGVAAALVVGSIGASAYGLRGQQIALAEQRVTLEASQKVTSERMARVGAHASRIDNDFLFYEGSVEGLSAAALHALTFGTAGPGGLIHWSTLGDPARAPAGMTRSPGYRSEINLFHPTWAAAPGVDAARVESILGKLSTLRGRMRHILFTTPSGLATSLAERRLPIEWVFVALESPGMIVLFPGAAGELDASYDPRERPWYRETIGTTGRRWGTPFDDAMGQGLAIACTEALYDDRGTFLGVAAITLHLEDVIATWLRPLLDPTHALHLPDATSATLLDADGGLLVRSTPTGDRVVRAAEPSEARPDPASFLPAAALVGLSNTPTGAVTNDEGEWVWSRLEHLGWTLIVHLDPKSTKETR